jgi:nicotinate-nucleotide pyrophosphorylase (carboxylating)
MAAAVAKAAAAARAAHPLRFVEVECDSLDQLQALLDLPHGTVDMALLDNMQPGMLADAVRMRDTAGVPMLLEASGGISLATIAAVAATGVERISVGALTHSAPCLDVGLDIDAA